MNTKKLVCPNFNMTAKIVGIFCPMKYEMAALVLTVDIDVTVTTELTGITELTKQIKKYKL